MIFFLDTNICIYFLKGQKEEVSNNLKKLKPEQVKIPAIVKAELLLGVHKSQHSKRNKELVQRFLEPYEIMPFGDSEAETYSEIRAELEKKGKPIGPNDLLIASTVICGNGVLVTNNEKEFKRIPRLRVENWIGNHKE